MPWETPGQTVQKKFKNLLTAAGCFAILAIHTVTTIETTIKMRTKTLLLVAAFTAAGLATSLAQTNVYSLNVVGYVNVPLPASTLANGFAILANPLNNGSNTLSQILPKVPLYTTVYKYTSGGFLSAFFDDDGFGNLQWDNPNMQFNPGEGFWLKNPGVATNVTFVGEVPQGTLTNDIPAGFALRGSVVPQALILLDADIDAASTNHGVVDLNYPATIDETVIYTFKDGGYTICNYTVGDFTPAMWDNKPIPAVGEGFWTKEVSVKKWVRSFTAQ